MNLIRSTSPIRPMLAALALAASPMIAQAVPPPNDQATNAELIASAGPFPYLTAITSIKDASATNDPPAPSCQGSVSRSLWYKFTPNATTSFTFSCWSNAPTATTVDDTVLAIYTGPLGGPYVEWPTTADTDGCDDDQNDLDTLHSIIVTRLNINTQYWIVAYKFGVTAPAANQTNIQLRVSLGVPPPLCSTNLGPSVDVKLTSIDAMSQVQRQAGVRVSDGSLGQLEQCGHE